MFILLSKLYIEKDQTLDLIRILHTVTNPFPSYIILSREISIAILVLLPVFSLDNNNFLVTCDWLSIFSEVISDLDHTLIEPKLSGLIYSDFIISNFMWLYTKHTETTLK